VIHFLLSFLIKASFNRIFNHYNPPLFIIQHKWMCRRDITCTNNASSSSSLLSLIIVTILYPSLPFSLLSYTSLLSLYLDWKPGPRCKGDSTLQLWCRACVTNFIWPYLHQFFDDSHGLKASLKPLGRPFDQYKSRLEAINNGQDIRQINW